MKLAKLTRPLATSMRERSSTSKAMPKKMKNVVNNPEQTPQEPKHRVNDRDRVRQTMGGDHVGKR
ncbi:MAG: hypothetical protein IT366_19440 [Candidatus Hydrogenedentes bacterium]|nr:hypothetical protein [Candidatus Hydrogenedentota bacterium]